MPTPRALPKKLVKLKTSEGEVDVSVGEYVELAIGHHVAQRRRVEGEGDGQGDGDVAVVAQVVLEGDGALAALAREGQRLGGRVEGEVGHARRVGRAVAVLQR
eukprot:scaffold550982_cov51-Prasinocladus_malaysianus.AAC.1